MLGSLSDQDTTYRATARGGPGEGCFDEQVADPALPVTERRGATRTYRSVRPTDRAASAVNRRVVCTPIGAANPWSHSEADP